MLKQPLSAAELQDLALAGQTGVPGLINPRSAVFKKMGVALEELDHGTALELIQSNPRILTRPVLRSPGVFISGYSEALYQGLLEKPA